MGKIILSYSGLLPFALKNAGCGELSDYCPVITQARGVYLTLSYMELKNSWFAASLARLLQWVNLRPEESERTWLMFAFYTTTSVGLRWSEDSTVALFLDEYGASSLPWIYIASAMIGILLVFLYSWLQKIFPLRKVIVAIAPSMFVPLVLMSWGMHVPHLAVGAIFLLKLWVDAFYVVNNLNTSIAANQLFNIRELKRAYPLVSSGILVADIVGGFSLPLLLLFFGLDKVIMPIAGIFIALGAAILWHLGNNYQQVFPDVPPRQRSGVQHQTSRLSLPLKRYALLLFAFFTLLQVLGVLIDFQYLTHLKINYNNKEIASFLGLFGGIAGLCELAMQLFISSRFLERFGVFITVATLPTSILILIPLAIALIQSQYFFWGLVLLKFHDELLRYTFVASSSILLFQPIPDKVRSNVQTLSGGIAEAGSALSAGVVIFVTLWLKGQNLQNLVLIVETSTLALLCLGVIWVLRSQYVNLLVLSAGRGKLSGTDIDLRAFKRAVVKTLGEKGTSADKRSCIELLAQIDPTGAGEVLASMLIKLPPSLQKPSLEIMLAGGANPACLAYVQALLNVPQPIVSHDTSTTHLFPEVFALALRYVCLCDPNPDLSALEEYLKQQNSVIRATAAALLLRLGTPIQKVTATNTLRRMLTSKLEPLRVHAVKALTEVVYLQALRLYIPNLLQDESQRVRCAVLSMIAATHLEEYYPALIKGLYYKSTRVTAMDALVRLENEALPMLVRLATNLNQPNIAQIYAWRCIGQIPTLEAIDTLWLHLEKSRGKTRDYILRTLLKRHQKEGIEGLVYGLNIKVEKLIEEEIRFLGEIYAAYVDLKIADQTQNNRLSQRFNAISELLHRALLELEIDVKERLLLLLKLIYPLENIQAASFNIMSKSSKNLARGVEILEHTINSPIKSLLLSIFDKQLPEEKLQKIVEKEIVIYQPRSVGDRLRLLIAQKDLLSDWCKACCFHFALIAQIRLNSEQILASLRHPTGFVREAAISYLNVVSSRVLLEILPQLQLDPHPLVAAQVKELMIKYQDMNYVEHD